MLAQGLCNELNLFFVRREKFNLWCDDIRLNDLNISIILAYSWNVQAKNMNHENKLQKVMVIKYYYFSC